MAYNFLGTIPSYEEFEEFQEFVRIESAKISKRIKHLQKEKSRLGELLARFKQADSQLRSDYPLSKSVDESYLLKPRPSPKRRPSYLDALNGADVDLLKKINLDTIKSKRERNEFKIKRIRDLMEQLENEASFLETEKENIEDTLNRIRTRFDLPDFEENQKIGEIDSADLQNGIKVITKGQGRQEIEGVNYYLVLKVDAGNKALTFDSVAPSVKPGEKIVLSNGNNDGSKTVVKYLNERTIQVSEDLKEETPPTTRVVVA